MAERWDSNPRSDAVVAGLHLYFGDKRRAWTIELTENITIGIDRQAETVVSLGGKPPP